MLILIAALFDNAHSEYINPARRQLEQCLEAAVMEMVSSPALAHEVVDEAYRRCDAARSEYRQRLSAVEGSRFYHRDEAVRRDRLVVMVTSRRNSVNPR